VKDNKPQGHPCLVCTPDSVEQVRDTIAKSAEVSLVASSHASFKDSSIR
jgi:hypothetical protein